MEHLACFLLFLTSFTTVSIAQDQFIYNGFSGSNLILDGTAMVTPNGILVLTNGTSTYKTSYALYPTPWQFWKVTSQSFSVNFVFFMAPSTRCPDSMAFMIFPSKVLKNDKRESNLAVNLVSCQDKRFVENNENYISISINNSFSRPPETHPAGFYDDKDGIFYDLLLVGGKAVQIWVDYNGEATQINVTIAPLNLTKPLRPMLSAILNLSTILGEGLSYIGFSSGANDVGASNYVLGWSFGMNSPAPTIDITKLPELPRFGPKVRFKMLKIILPIVITTAILLMGATVAALCRRMRYASLYEDWEVEFGPYRFSYKYLFDATEGFKNEKILGVGGFGKVYKGVLPDSKLEVAIKRVSHESKQGMKEFIAEIVSIGRIRHRNLVQLLGYCRRKGELLLVYDHMPNGSLDKYLHSKDDKSTLDWGQRFHIIRGVASGLFYLHEKWEKVVIHRDIKASNVLLDAEMNGHLGDFGLARLYEHGNDPQTTHVAGTFGYIAPEMARTGKASPLTDVYAFGIFILEVTCGRKPINNYAQDSPTTLVDWVVEHWQKGSLTSTLDVRLQGDHHNADEVNLVLKLGLLCANPICSGRPSMRQVMQYLDNEMPLPELMPTNLSYSMLGYLQNYGFDQYKSVPSTVCNNNLTSSLTSGR